MRKRQLMLCIMAFLCLCCCPAPQDKYEKQFADAAKRVLPAIETVESGGNPNAHNVDEDAVGVLQIRKVMVDDVNRILKLQKRETRYTYEDRWDIDKSREMFMIYSKRYCDHTRTYTEEYIAKNWNGGPKGYEKPSTNGYWKRVERVMKGGTP